MRYAGYLLLGCAVCAWAQDTHYAPKNQLIPAPECMTLKGAWTGGSGGPCPAGTHRDWLQDLRHWREERRIRIGYDGARYARPEFGWVGSSFLQPQMMVHDRYFYDPAQHRYTVDRYLNDLKNRYGGIDAALIWATYPNMGIDDRNQLDMVRTMPGGVAGVRAAVEDFHRRGVRVLFPMMMWDQGTRPPDEPWPQAIAALMKELGADGINGDTQDGVPLAFSRAADESGHPLVFQPEGSPSDEALAWNLMTWGQYAPFGFVPGVDRFRWLEPRHGVNISDRWNRSKTDDLQYAFFNGEGWESWENIWGIWNGITPRDAEATRRVATLERALAPFFRSEDWEPLYPMQAYGVFASRWTAGGDTLWTVVSRNEYDVDSPQMSVPAGAAKMRFFDLYHGVELHASDGLLSFALEAHGFGAILQTAADPRPELARSLTEMKTMTAQPLRNFPAEWTALHQHLVAAQPAKPAASAPAGMVKIPGGVFSFRVQGIEIEGSDDIGVDVQYPWEDSARRFHQHTLPMRTFYIDRTPVTNAEFGRFLEAAHYRPEDAGNFLRDWKDGRCPNGWENKPVTWVSLDDARAYAQWAGKRLPAEWEWQRAAEGADGRTYPWGNEWNAQAVPEPEKGRALRAPDDVDAHPAGISPYGVLDLVGNVWQWTDEYEDEHTRAAILRGGSYYQPQGSIWYFPQAYRNDQHGKLLLLAPSYDRSGTVGFRCVVDGE